MKLWVLRQCWRGVSTSTLAWAGNQYTSLAPLKGTGAELNFGTHGLQSDIFHAVGEPGFDLADHARFRIDPGYARQVQRIFPSPQSQGRRRSHARNMLELNFVKLVPVKRIFAQIRELKARGIIGVEDEKQSRESIADKHGHTLFLRLSSAREPPGAIRPG